MTNWLTGSQNELPADWLVGHSTNRLDDQRAHWLGCKLTDQLIDFIASVTDWMFNWLIDSFTWINLSSTLFQ